MQDAASLKNYCKATIHIPSSVGFDSSGCFLCIVALTQIGPEKKYGMAQKKERKFWQEVNKSRRVSAEID